MKLALTFGYWPAKPTPDVVAIAQEAERVGFDSVWVAESWGNDAFTYLTWLAAHTERVRLGTGVVQLAARTPAATAMAAMTIDHLSGGRMMLGLGVSGPQVVEGWYGRPSDKPLARTREYVDIVRKALRREGPLESDGPFYPLPYRGEGATGLGKPLKIMTHPLRSEIPIFLGAEGPKNVAQTAEIADGWLPLYYSPFRQEVYADQLAAAKPGFEITALANLTITDDVSAGLWPVRAMLGFYIGGMGARTITPNSWPGWGTRKRRCRFRSCSSPASVTKQSPQYPKSSPTRFLSSGHRRVFANGLMRGGRAR
jgi:F420-dependent oxidoreductase-like protein